MSDFTGIWQTGIDYMKSEGYNISALFMLLTETGGGVPLHYSGNSSVPVSFCFLPSTPYFSESNPSFILANLLICERSELVRTFNFNSYDVFFLDCSLE